MVGAQSVVSSQFGLKPATILDVEHRYSPIPKILWWNVLVDLSHGPLPIMTENSSFNGLVVVVDV